MNNKSIYLPISFAVLASIVFLSLEIPSFGLMTGFVTLLTVAAFLSLLLSFIMYLCNRSKFDRESMYTFIGTSLLCSFIFFLATISIFNRMYATNSCEIASFHIVAYQGRYTSGYGNVKKDKLKANQWILKAEINGQIEQFTLEKDISNGKPVTRTMELEFCKGIYSTKYLRVE
ncbi:MAG: amino acid transporter [Saprospiraceae bacterium]|jgi:amino acid transporter